MAATDKMFLRNIILHQIVYCGSIPFKPGYSVAPSTDKMFLRNIVLHQIAIVAQYPLSHGIP